MGKRSINQNLGTILSIGSVILLLVGCGDAEEPVSPLFSSLSAPVSECPSGGTIISMGLDTNRDGGLNGDEVTKEIVVCDGEDGEDGADGQDGVDGTDNRVISTLFCQGTLQATVFDFEYTAVVLASGDVWAYGAIEGADAQVGESAFYSAKQNGAQTASVFFTADLEGADNWGWWEISVDRSTSIATIEYTDDDFGASPVVWTATPEECMYNEY